MKDLFVRRIYTKNGVSIVVELDFVKKTVSFTEKDGKPKHWRFTDRTPDYLNGWRAILAAMDYAVVEVQKEMAALSDKEHKEFVELYMALDRALKKGEFNGEAK